jgi:hypothetical protein
MGIFADFIVLVVGFTIGLATDLNILDFVGRVIDICLATDFNLLDAGFDCIGFSFDFDILDTGLALAVGFSISSFALAFCFFTTFISRGIITFFFI